MTPVTPVAPEPVRTEPVRDCPACGASGPVRYRNTTDPLHGVDGVWNVRRCTECGTHWLDPRPIADDIGRCYPEHYFTHAAGDDNGGKPFTALQRAVLARAFGYETSSDAGASHRAIAAVASVAARVPAARTWATNGFGPRLPQWVSGGRLLDVGCGSGTYLARMRELGWDVLGVEVDPVAAEQARTRRGLAVVEDIEKVPADEQFDVITLNHVIEHVADPARFLQLAVERLRPGGSLVVITPNAKALGHRAFKAGWYHLDPPRHLFVLSPEGMRRLVSPLPVTTAQLATSARSASKIGRQAAGFRRSGGFRRVPATAVDKVGARAFAAVERVGALLSPVGEELDLVAIRRRST